MNRSSLKSAIAKRTSKLKSPPPKNRCGTEVYLEKQRPVWQSAKELDAEQAKIEEEKRKLEERLQKRVQDQRDLEKERDSQIATRDSNQLRREMILEYRRTNAADAELTSRQAEIERCCTRFTELQEQIASIENEMAAVSLAIQDDARERDKSQDALNAIDNEIAEHAAESQRLEAMRHEILRDATPDQLRTDFQRNQDAVDRLVISFNRSKSCWCWMRN